MQSQLILLIFHDEVSKICRDFIWGSTSQSKKYKNQKKRATMHIIVILQSIAAQQREKRGREENPLGCVFY
jgi:hypothetical protein